MTHATVSSLGPAPSEPSGRTIGVPACSGAPGFTACSSASWPPLELPTMPTRRAIDPQALGVSADVAHAGGHVGTGRGVLVIGPLAEVERDDDQSAGRQGPAVDGATRAIVPAPGAAVHVDDRGQRRGRVAARTVDARQQLDAAGPRKRDVGLVDFVRRARIETNGRGHRRVLLFAYANRLAIRSPALPPQGRTAGASIFIPRRARHQIELEVDELGRAVLVGLRANARPDSCAAGAAASPVPCHSSR